MTPIIDWGPALVIFLGFVLIKAWQTYHMDRRFDQFERHLENRIKEMRIAFLEDAVRRLEKRLESRR